MQEEYFENTNRDQSLLGVIESSHWKSAEDPEGIILFTLYVFEKTKNLKMGEHLRDTFELCSRQAERDFDFDPANWKKAPYPYTWPKQTEPVTKAFLDEMIFKLESQTKLYRQKFDQTKA